MDNANCVDLRKQILSAIKTADIAPDIKDIIDFLP
jgi:hypothetical protein